MVQVAGVEVRREKPNTFQLFLPGLSAAFSASNSEQGFFQIMLKTL